MGQCQSTQRRHSSGHYTSNNQRNQRIVIRGFVSNERIPKRRYMPTRIATPVVTPLHDSVGSQHIPKSPGEDVEIDEINGPVVLD